MTYTPRFSLLLAIFPIAATAYSSDVLAWGGRQTLTRPVVAITAGNVAATALQDNGRAVAWGQSPCRACAIPYAMDSVISVAVGSEQTMLLLAGGRVVTIPSTDSVTDTLPRIKAIAAGGATLLALGEDGRVRSWGPQGIAFPPDTLHDVIAIAAGMVHSMALRKDGSVVVWGDPAVPAADPGLRATAIAAGNNLALAIRPDSTVVVWGENRFGDADIPPDLKVMALASNASYTLAILPDGTLRAFGDGAPASIPVGRTGVRNIQANGAWMFFDMLNGSIQVQGFPHAALRQPDPNALPPAELATAAECGVWRRQDGILAFDTTTPTGWTPRPEGFDTTEALGCAMGGNIFISRIDSPHVARWGTNFCGEEFCNPPEDLPRIVRFAATSRFVAGLTPEGRVVAWGGNRVGMNADSLPNLIDLASDGDAVIGLDGDGHVHLVAETGDEVTGPRIAMPADLADVVAIAGGSEHFLALRKDGSVVAWGYNHYTQATVPPNLPPARAIAAGWDFSAILLRDTPMAVPRHPHPTPASLTPGIYRVKAISIHGRTQWTGMATWTGMRWASPAIPPGIWIVTTPGNKSKASLLVRLP